MLGTTGSGRRRRAGTAGLDGGARRPLEVMRGGRLSCTVSGADRRATTHTGTPSCGPMRIFHEKAGIIEDRGARHASPGPAASANEIGRRWLARTGRTTWRDEHRSVYTSWQRRRNRKRVAWMVAALRRIEGQPGPARDRA